MRHGQAHHLSSSIEGPIDRPDSIDGAASEPPSPNLNNSKPSLAYAPAVACAHACIRTFARQAATSGPVYESRQQTPIDELCACVSTAPASPPSPPHTPTPRSPALPQLEPHPKQNPTPKQTKLQRRNSLCVFYSLSIFCSSWWCFSVFVFVAAWRGARLAC